MCVKYLHNRFGLRFLTHVVDDHKMDHDVAIDVLERLHAARTRRD
jgi:hypothetical protein